MKAWLTGWMIDDWRKAWTFLSVRRATYGFTLSAIGGGLKASTAAAALMPFLPEWEVSLVAALLFLSVVIGRLTKQPPPPPPDAPDDGWNE